jgi:hypothetical protein
MLDYLVHQLHNKINYKEPLFSSIVSNIDKEEDSCKKDEQCSSIAKKYDKKEIYNHNLNEKDTTKLKINNRAIKYYYYYKHINSELVSEKRKEDMKVLSEIKNCIIIKQKLIKEIKNNTCSIIIQNYYRRHLIKKNLKNK